MFASLPRQALAGRHRPGHPRIRHRLLHAQAVAAIPQRVPAVTRPGRLPFAFAQELRLAVRAALFRSGDFQRQMHPPPNRRRNIDQGI